MSETDVELQAEYAKSTDPMALASAILIDRFETFADETECALAMGFAIDGNRYSIVISREGSPSIGQRLYERYQIIKGLLGIIESRTSEPMAAEYVALYDRAAKLIADVEECESRGT